jgi:molybdopterin synthase catalytic subunit
MTQPYRITVSLTGEPLSLDAAFKAVSLPECGGTAVFVGTTRNHSEGRRGVEELEYEAYDELAAKELERVAVEAIEKHGLGAAYLAHRVGIVPVGEPSVIVAASAAHRGEAFAGARAVIDRVKAEAPIWKVEVEADGTQRRVEGTLPPV